MGGIPVGGMFTNGKGYFLNPYSVSDSQSGTSIARPWKTLSHAQTKATADKNDVVYMFSESNTAASTTDYQSTALAWAKDGVHLIGVNSGSRLSQRARIAQLSTATNVDNLFTVSADNCYIANISVFHGVADATSIGAVLVSGQRNHFYNCHFAGIGHATQDVATNYSLSLTGSENVFEDCTIGLDTISRATATYEIYMSGGATRNIFRKCRIVSYAGAAAYTFITVPVNGLDRWNLFEDCQFINMPTGVAAGTTMTQGFAITGGGSPDGCLILKDCKFIGMAASESAASDKLYYFANGTGKMVATAF
jgi:hypothetical protein